MRPNTKIILQEYLHVANTLRQFGFPSKYAKALRCIVSKENIVKESDRVHFNKFSLPEDKERDAFSLHLRRFLLQKEDISLNKITNILSDSELTENFKVEVRTIVESFNNYYKSIPESEIILLFSSFLSEEEIIEIRNEHNFYLQKDTTIGNLKDHPTGKETLDLLFNGKGLFHHDNDKKINAYQDWIANPASKLSFTLESDGILIKIYNFIIQIADLITDELA
jgi:hypothetical protein